MSKRFKSQDYFRYPRLRNKWRKPKGRQSKMRLRKGGSGLVARIGYGTDIKNKNKVLGLHCILVKNKKDFENAKEAVIISSSVGAKKALMLAEEAKKLNLRIINMKKVKKAENTAKEIKKKGKIEERKKEEKKEEIKNKE